jgi:hypothetical protein
VFCVLRAQCEYILCSHHVCMCTSLKNTKLFCSFSLSLSLWRERERERESSEICKEKKENLIFLLSFTIYTNLVAILFTNSSRDPILPCHNHCKSSIEPYFLSPFSNFLLMLHTLSLTLYMCYLYCTV